MNLEKAPLISKELAWGEYLLKLQEKIEQCSTPDDYKLILEEIKKFSKKLDEIEEAAELEVVQSNLKLSDIENEHSGFFNKILDILNHKKETLENKKKELKTNVNKIEEIEKLIMSIQDELITFQN